MTKKIFTIGALIFAIAIGTYVIYNSGLSEESNVYFPGTSIVPKDLIPGKEDSANLNPDKDKKDSPKETKPGETSSPEEDKGKTDPALAKKDSSKGKDKATPKKEKDLNPETPPKQEPNPPVLADQPSKDEEHISKKPEGENETLPKEDINPQLPPSIKPRPYEKGKKKFLNFFLPEGHGNWDYKEKRIIYGEPQSLFFRIVKKLIESDKYENVTENICHGIYGYFRDMDWDESEMEKAEPTPWLEEEGKLIWGEIWKYCSYFGPSEDSQKPDFWPYTTKKLRVPFVDWKGRKAPGKGLGYVKEVEIVTNAYHTWFTERFKRKYKNKTPTTSAIY